MKYLCFILVTIVTNFSYGSDIETWADIKTWIAKYESESQKVSPIICYSTDIETWIAKYEGEIQKVIPTCSAKTLGGLALDMKEEASSFSTEQLNDYCIKQGYEKWPKQKDWVSFLIGKTFYPEKEIADIYEAYGEERVFGKWILERRDVRWRLGISGFHQVTPAKFYFSYIFYKKRPNDSNQTMRKIRSFFKEVFQEFTTLIDTSSPLAQEAAYFILKEEYGPCLHAPYDLLDAYEDKAYNLLKTSAHKEHRFLCLLFSEKFKYKKYTEKPTPEDFRNWGREMRYPLAFIHGLSGSLEEKIEALKSFSSEMGDNHLISLTLGELYRELGNKTKQNDFTKDSEIYFLKALYPENPETYLRYIKLYTPYDRFSCFYDFKEVQDLERLKEFEQKLSEVYTKHPEAAFALALLRHEIGGREKSKDWTPIIEAAEQAVRLGSSEVRGHLEKMNRYLKRKKKTSSLFQGYLDTKDDIRVIYETIQGL